MSGMRSSLEEEGRWRGMCVIAWLGGMEIGGTRCCTVVKMCGDAFMLLELLSRPGYNNNGQASSFV